MFKIERQKSEKRAVATTKMLGMMVQETTTPPAAIHTRKHLLSTAMKRTSEWIFSHEIPSDITIQVGGAAFSLHKFPLMSKCGYIRKLISEANGSNISLIEMPDIPGSAEAFELVAKFCYGINFEISTDNIAMLRCAAEYLQMTDDYVDGNLVSRTEAYFEEVVLVSLSGAATVLHNSEGLHPMSEKVKLVSRCIDAVAYIACNDSQFSSLLKTENGQESLSSSSSQTKSIVDWWAEELIVLRIDTFQRVLMAMMARGFSQYALGPVLMLYAQNSLRGLDIFGRRRKKIEPKLEHEKRVVLETVVSLLPRERNAMSISFLSMLLRAAIYLETTVACRLDLEKRMGLQLEQGVLDDLLIPSFSTTSDTMFDVDTVQKILVSYLEHEVEGCQMGYNTDEDYVYPPPGDMERIGKLMESYLAEIASDANLAISKFISLAEMIPEQARFTEDGMYRAIDIYLKAHPSLSDIDRKKICGLMDCQKLSREACAHAAQNDRLPVQIVVQVLYYEQQRIRDTMDGSLMGGESPASSQKMSSHGSANHKASDELSCLRRENADLKLELIRVKMQLKQTEKPPGSVSSADKPPLPKKSANVSSAGSASSADKPPSPKKSANVSSAGSVSSADKPPLPKKSVNVSSAGSISSTDKPPLLKKSFIDSVSKKLGRLYPFVHSDSIKPLSGRVRTKPPKDRRHSVS